jgi:hypothetical protein
MIALEHYGRLEHSVVLGAIGRRPVSDVHLEGEANVAQMPARPVA